MVKNATAGFFLCVASLIAAADPTETYPIPDPELGEQLQDDEAEIAVAIGDAISRSLTEKYPSGVIKRDAHPKSAWMRNCQFHSR